MLELSNPLRPSWSARQLLWLMQFRNIASGRALTISRAIPNPGHFRDKWPDVLARLGPAFSSVPASDVEEIPRFPQILAVGAFDTDYPAQLASIPNPPAVIWVRGTLRTDIPHVAVVGTRHPTDFGSNIASVAATHSVHLGFGVISGLALGIDSIAHESALNAGGYTIAVLAGSLELPQPRRNELLAKRILDSGGALICETYPDAIPAANTLVARNRIQSGLAVATVIAQSGIPGGTLHTARFAIEQDRRLVVPRPLGDRRDDPSNAGNVALTEPGYVDPSVLKASKKTAALIAQRRPIADDCPESPAELKHALEAL